MGALCPDKHLERQDFCPKQIRHNRDPNFLNPAHRDFFGPGVVCTSADHNATHDDFAVLSVHGMLHRVPQVEMLRFQT